MKFKYIRAVFFQAAGPILLLFLTITISRFWGAAEQGGFASAKAWFDLLVVVGCFGFPQSCVIAINRTGACRIWLYRATIVYCAVLFPILSAASFYLGGQQFETFVTASCLAFGCCCVVLVNIWRGILLTFNDEGRFHLITILPTLALVLSVFVTLCIGQGVANNAPYIYAFVGAAVLPVAAIIFPYSAVKKRQGVKPNIFQLINNGTDVFVQAGTTALQTLLCITWLKSYSTLEEVGYFSICLVAFNSLVFPLQAIAPMILNKWSRQKGHESLQMGTNVIATGVTFLTILVGLIVMFMPQLAAMLFGAQFAAAVTALQVALVIAIPTFVLRINNLRLSAAAHFRVNSVTSALRCALFAILIILSTIFMEDLLGATLACVCWLTAETFAMMVTHHRIKQILLKGTA